MKNKNKIFLALIISLIISYFLVHKLWSDYNDFVRFPVHNTKDIVLASKKYHQEMRRPPANIEDLINKGYLPSYAKFYRSYLRHKSENISSVHINSIEYAVEFPIENPGDVVFLFERSDLDNYYLPGRNFKDRFKYTRRYALIK